MWRPTVAWGGRGARETGQQGRETGPGQGESDAWRLPKQEVEWQWRHSSGRGSCTAPAVEGAEQGSRGCQRKKKGGGGVFSRDLVVKYRNPRDLTVKQNSPLIKNSNEEVTKIKVVEFFKPYNIALEFKFKNPRYTALNFKI
jgi:hypothetical protein